MCEESNETERKSLESMLFDEEGEIHNKFANAEFDIDYHPPRKVTSRTGIDYEVAKLMDLKRKKYIEMINLKREIYELDYEIDKKYEEEVKNMKNQFKRAYEMMDEGFSIKEITTATNLTEKQIKKLL